MAPAATQNMMFLAGLFFLMGMQISFSAAKGIGVGNIVETEVLMPHRKEPIKVAGEIVWFKQEKGNGITHSKAGIKLTRIAAADKWELLDRAYDKWYGNLSKQGEQTPRQITY